VTNTSNFDSFNRDIAIDQQTRTPTRSSG
jgi:hypothetical protein